MPVERRRRHEREFAEVRGEVGLVEVPGEAGDLRPAAGVAVSEGRSMSVSAWVNDALQLKREHDRLERRLHYYAKVGLLVVDELGFLAFDNRNADLIFQVVSRRYEKKSLILTTNLAFADWHTIFPSATCATALVECVVHHADIVKIEGESYRLRESQVDATARGTSRRDKKPSADN